MGRGKKEHASIAPIGYDPRDMLNAAEVSIKDGDQSLLTMTDGVLHNAIAAIPNKLLRLSEKDLKKHCNPDELTCRIRIQFWDEYVEAVDAGRAIQVRNVMRNLTYSEYFFSEVLSDEKKMAWITRPPQDFLLAMRDLLYVGLERLREVLELPIVERVPMLTRAGALVRDEKGEIVYRDKVNTSVAKEIRAITEKLADRVKGAVVQRHQVQAAHAHALIPGVAGALPADPLEALSSQLQAVNQRLALAERTEPDVIDADTTGDILLESPDRSE